jgi:RNA polymerase sigma factor (sigma-70 family)
MNATGLKAVFLAERPTLLRLLTARLRDPDAAAEVLQDMWLKLEGGGSGPVAEPAAYLFRMANNLAFDHRRSHARRSARDGQWLDSQSQASELPDAEDMLLARERLAQLQATIAALPERTASIFRAYRIDGVPRKDIAAREGISVSAVEKHLHRAYQAVLAMQDNEKSADIAGA